MTSWRHPACFNLPKAFITSGTSNKEDAVISFLEDAIEDEEGTLQNEETFEKIKTEIMEAGTKKTPKKKAAAAAGGEGGGDDDGFMGKLKQEYNAMVSGAGDDDKDKEKKSKKRKSSDNEEVPDPKRAKQLDAYGEIHKWKADDLKNELRWNRQVLVGTKPVLLRKVIDGRVNGRLAHCPDCGGKFYVFVCHYVCFQSFVLSCLVFF